MPQEGLHEAEQPRLEAVGVVVELGIGRLAVPQLIDQIAGAFNHQQVVLGLGRVDVEERLLTLGLLKGPMA